MAETMRVYGELRRAWEKLGDLAYAAPASLKVALEDAARRLKAETGDEGARPAEQLFFKGWLERLALDVGRLLSHAVDSFRRSVSADRHPPEADIFRALNEGRYADAVFLRSEASGVPNKPKVARRQTDWRKSAWSRFPDHSQALKSFRDSLGQSIRSKADLNELIEKWLQGVSGSLTDDQRLRTTFANVVFADTFGGGGRTTAGAGQE